MFATGGAFERVGFIFLHMRHIRTSNLQSTRFQELWIFLSFAMVCGVSQFTAKVAGGFHCGRCLVTSQIPQPGPISGGRLPVGPGRRRRRPMGRRSDGMVVGGPVSLFFFFGGGFLLLRLLLY